VWEKLGMGVEEEPKEEDKDREEGDSYGNHENQTSMEMTKKCSI